MPCNDWEILGDNWSTTDDIAREMAKDAAKKANKSNATLHQAHADLKKAYQDIAYLKQRLDNVTAHLCFVMGTLTKDNSDMLEKVLQNPLLREWWEDHQKWDAERERNNNHK